MWLEAIFCWESLAKMLTSIKILATLYALLGVTWGHLLLRISSHNVDKYQNPCNFICTTWCDLRPSFVENLLPQCWQVSKSMQFYMHYLVWLEAIFCWESLATMLISIKILAILYALLGVTWGHLLLRISCHNVDKYQNPCNFICTTWCDLRPSFVENLLLQCWPVSNPCNFICTTWCDLRPSFVENLLPQCWPVSKSLQFYMHYLVWLEAIFCWESLATMLISIKILAILYALLGVTWGHLLLRISCHSVDIYKVSLQYVFSHVALGKMAKQIS